MDTYLANIKGILAYIDDILFFTKIKEEHIQLLRRFRTIIKDSGIALSENKAEILKNKIEFLETESDEYESE